MPPSVLTEKAIPLFPCASLDETLDFYRTLGFEVTHQQKAPYVYGAVRRGAFDLHFHGFKGLDPKKAFSTCLVIVSEVAPYHRAFADALREKLGKVPTAGLPRITRLRPGQGRFTVVDPSGNSILFIKQEEPEPEEWSSDQGRSRLAQALDTVANLRDMQNKDEAAAKVLDVALLRDKSADPITRARALAARAELAVAMGDAERARAVWAELREVPLSKEDRRRFRDELEAAEELQRWLTQKESVGGKR